MVVEISRDAEREAVFAVAGEDVARATPGMQVKVWLQAQPEVAVTGSVREISPVADSTTGTYEVRSRCLRRRGRCASAPSLSAAPKPRAGSHDAARHRAPAVRRRCAGLGRVQGQPGAPAHVELLEFDMDSVVVAAGLAPGEMVVTAGVNSLADGQDVKPEMELR